MPGPGSSAKFFALRGVADLSPASAYAVGTDPGVAYHWDGTAWRTVSLPDTGFVASSITAVSATDIWLTGSTSAGATAEAMNFNGATWTAVPVQQPGGTNSAVLNAVTAVAANDIWAVGVRPAAPIRRSFSATAEIPRRHARQTCGVAGDVLLACKQPHVASLMSGLRGGCQYRAGSQVHQAGAQAAATSLA